jgi:hypothetical protein
MFFNRDFCSQRFDYFGCFILLALINDEFEFTNYDSDLIFFYNYILRNEL